MIKAIIFDFGQTLVNSANGFRLAEKQAETRIFQDLELGSWSDFLTDYRRLRKDFHTKSNFSRQDLWQAVYRYYDREPNAALISKAEGDYWDTVKSNTRPFPETKAALEQLVSEYRLALITNTQGQVTLGSHRISLFPGLANLFDVVIVAGEAGVPPKPNRAPFLLCLEKLGIAPTEAIFVGDDWRIDICGAKEVGIHPVWLKHHSVSRKWPEVETSVPVIINLEQLADWIGENWK
ncbi:MAG: HAD family hydrolase [Anaerolineales bacterium]|nr:HAD family hydrolase [Anaerolineales bacterium]